ncbi:hypothetical protein EVAR_76719_1 [Eumeta japonica]|uniref:Uncharacterized protein n=1 Tax=Eumeta variegata TaxID=151549 RepID=A0A4C1STI5_EUMVA|nr:hypothetical protein EVAR_76719_1 [Eumeta japonica]
MDTRTGALPTSREGIEYLKEGNLIEGRRRGGVSYENSHSLDEIQHRKLLLHYDKDLVLCACVIDGGRYSFRCSRFHNTDTLQDNFEGVWPAARRAPLSLM